MKKGSMHNGEVRVRGKDDGCCGVFFLKYVLYMFNVFFWVSGLAFVGVGVWTMLDKHHYVTLLSSNTYEATTYLLLATGGIIILVGILGCCGACNENRICLMTFASILLLVFLMEATAGVLAYLYESTVHDELTNYLKNTMLDNYMMDLERTKAINAMQQDFHCCGAKSFQDWRESRWLKGNPSIKNTAPDSCCKSYTEGCAVRDHPSNIYYDGCIPSLEHYIREHLIILGAVGLGICCLQIFGIIFSCCLAKKIKDFRERQKANHW